MSTQIITLIIVAFVELTVIISVIVDVDWFFERKSPEQVNTPDDASFKVVVELADPLKWNPIKPPPPLSFEICISPPVLIYVPECSVSFHNVLPPVQSTPPAKSPPEHVNFPGLVSVNAVVTLAERLKWNPIPPPLDSPAVKWILPSVVNHTPSC